ncbi:MAG: GDSL-type esterase/lipase family protein [Pseudomonadota bacterium]
MTSLPIRRRALLFAAAAGLAACGKKKAPALQALPPGSVVLALGDSITHGTGAPPEAAYPAQLAQLTGWTVINGGVPGDTSAQALERLPALLAQHKPALLIVSIGGNDFLRRLSEADTAANVRRIVAAGRDAGAQVLLVAVPRPTLAAAAGAGLADHPLYEKLGGELALPVHSGGWSRVLGDEQLKSDQIHANAAGYRVFAEALTTTLRAMGLLR